MSSSPRDENRVPGLVAKSDADDTPVVIEADPITKRLKVNATITGTVQTTPAEGGASEDYQTIQTDVLNEIRSAVQAIAYARGIAADLRVTLLGGTTAVTGTLTAVTTVTGLTNIGGIPAVTLVQSNQNVAAVLSNINNVAV